MSYIIKDTSGLINTRVTDVGRRKLSQGNFNITSFQVGDSEMDYRIPANYVQTNNNILMPAFNSQNDTFEANKQYVKYPYFVTGSKGSTYGIPFEDSGVQVVYNSAGSKGFFVSGSTGWSLQSGTAYTVTSQYYVDMGTLVGQTTVTLSSDGCGSSTATPQVGDYITFYFDGSGACDTFTNGLVLTYRIQAVAGTTVTLDRPVPDFSGMGGSLARTQIYSSGMTGYDYATPAPYWTQDAINFETPCDTMALPPPAIWNMNIPWSESPAGLFSSTHEDYSYYGSISYAGSKEYLGYTSDSGQTDTSETFYYNSLDQKVVVKPSEQKAIAIIHYTNQAIDNVYGEKFATVPFDPENPTDATGLASHFIVSMPTLMWHKSITGTIGENFYIDPPSFTGYCEPHYIKSLKNVDMNDPGIRYFHLWDTNPDSNNNLNRVGKVFPDQEIIVIDDEELVAAMSYKSNRTYTLPAPGISAVAPNICGVGSTNIFGVLQYQNQKMWVSYLLGDGSGEGTLHCNYYPWVYGPTSGCTTGTLDVALRFGPEFPFLGTAFSPTFFKVICQITTGDTRPSPTEWRIIDFTADLGGTISQATLASTTFVITADLYSGASIYNLADYLDIPLNGFPDQLNFGDEYFFYGNVATDIEATIYEMRYLITLGRNQFTYSQNPTWTSGSTSYVTEIGLYDSEKDLIVVSKLQSPQKRQGIQQFLVKLDF